MRHDWALVTAPTIEPLTLADAKLHIGVAQDDDNQLLSSFIKAGRQAAENYLSRGLLTQTWKLQLDRFYDAIWLPMAAPLQSVTHVKYYDASGVEQTLATSGYTVDTVSEPGRIVRAPDQSWPSLQSDRQMPVTITYVCGWTSAATVPEVIKQGIRFFVAYLDAQRVGDQQQMYAMRAAYAMWDAAGPAHWRPPQVCL